MNVINRCGDEVLKVLEVWCSVSRSQSSAVLQLPHLRPWVPQKRP